jgi:hypothetical protein
MMFNAIFSNISVISVGEIGVPGERKNTDLQQTDKLYYIMLHRVVISTNCIGSCNSNYHNIMTTTASYNEDLLYTIYHLNNNLEKKIVIKFL